tara:strand:+ start:1085 stop:2026 length:942 start_codon:yes stop_codon:yes gene_type:complete
MNISLYTSDDRDEWNAFTREAKNSHFMFHRDYMEYHADLFSDFSIIVRNDKQEIIGIIPANLENRTLHSHQGLSFGGLCIRKDVGTSMVLDIFNSLIIFLKNSNQVDELIYKRLPDFYTNYPSQEDLYALFILDSNLFRRDVSVAIDLQQPLPISKMRKRHSKKAIKNNIVISEENDFSNFWELLTDVLQKQHGVNPVHSLDEIKFLRAKFPEHIRCFVARKDSKIISGTLIFETENVAHAQYLANGEIGRELGGLDLLIIELIGKYSGKKKFFDLGISTEESGTVLNKGLISQKEGFGARAFVHEFYSISLT